MVGIDGLVKGGVLVGVDTSVFMPIMIGQGGV